MTKDANYVEPSNTFLANNISSTSDDNLPLYSTTLDLIILQNDVNVWKQSYNQAVWEIDELKNQRSVLELEVSVWKARFFALRSGFIELDRKMRQIMASFEGWKD